MMVNLLDDSNFHRQTPVMTRLIEMIIQNPVFGIFCIISMLGNQNPYIEEEQTKQWPKEKVQKDKQRSTKHSRM
jgi:hypothetical protein